MSAGDSAARLFFTPPARVAIEGPAAWLRHHREAASGLGDTVLRALAGGRAADRPGWAFASGYAEALRRLVPSLGDRTVCLAATEAGGAHPRAIATTLAGGRLDGVKRFVTLAPACDAALVIASEGAVAGKNRLAAVLVPLDRQGVSLEPLPPTAFAPEIPHAAVSFRDVPIAAGERLPGDGYDDYLKPFRTVEDVHVMAALTGWLAAALAAAPGAEPLLEELAALAASLVAIGSLDPRAPATHRILGGALAGLHAAIARADPLWAGVDAETAARWQRDRPLLEVAGSVRAARLNRARIAAIE